MWRLRWKKCASISNYREIECESRKCVYPICLCPTELFYSHNELAVIFFTPHYSSQNPFFVISHYLPRTRRATKCSISFRFVRNYEDNFEWNKDGLSHIHAIAINLQTICVHKSLGCCTTNDVWHVINEIRREKERERSVEWLPLRPICDLWFCSF